MLGILQDYAEQWYNEQNNITTDEGEPSKEKTQTCNNLVLGYVRCINAEYDSIYGDGSIDKWTLIAGEVPTDFISYVEKKESSQSGLELKEYFASFLQNGTNTYNKKKYGNIDEEFLHKNFLLVDPLGSGEKIDLIHLFASMDGIYYYTDRNNLVCNRAFTERHDQDMVSWLGDLQTYAKEIYDLEKKDVNINNFPTYQLSLGTIDFGNFVKDTLSEEQKEDAPGSFPVSDLLADVDAMNIAKLFLNCAPNTVRDSLMGYYVAFWNDSSSNGNRYYEFIYTCTRAVEIASTGDLLTDFTNEIYHSMNLKRGTDGTVENWDYYDITDPLKKYNVNFLFDDEGVFASFKSRKYSTNLFYDYIIQRSYRFSKV